MSLTTLLIVLLGLTALAFHIGRGRATTASQGDLHRLHSLPGYHGAYVAIWCGVPALLIIVAWAALEGHVIEFLALGNMPAHYGELQAGAKGLLLNDIRNLTNGINAGGDVEPAVQAAADSLVRYRAIAAVALATVALAAAILGLQHARRRITHDFRARNAVEKTISALLIISSTVAIFTTIGIVLSLAFETVRFFAKVPIGDFLFGLQWSPQTAIRADQVGATGSFGAIPLFVGTLLVTFIAMLVAAPVGLMSAIYLSEYASPRLRSVAKPVLEVLAGVPTVVYGFFAAITVTPVLRDLGADIGLDVASESALAAGLVMGIMIIPFVSSLSDDVINAVPQAMRDGSFALGATPSETIKRVVLPAALPGVVAAILLAISRAIGETMIVVMAAGFAANMTANPLQAVTTVTVQIVTLLVGDQEFDSAKTLAAFALGLVLLLATLALNVIALAVVRRYREVYE
ncbi:MAG: phosphate ABC transporter permease subunit PstC [Alphaproteobacteria bacterium]|jgi:phosphate transport system permease protein|nr:phosphate ABC transporter permease subunit PstC [Alphaproteobacteria bacterium]